MNALAHGAGRLAGPTRPAPARSRPTDFGPVLLLVSPVAVLALWWWVSCAGIFPEQLLVSPWAVVEAFAELLRRGELQEHLGKSLRRLGLGYVAGVGAGLAFGIAMGLSKSVECYFAAAYHGVRQVPSIAFITMFVLLFGVEESFKIIIVAKAAFFPVSLSTYEAVRGIPRSYFDVARVYCLPTAVLVRRVVLPATIPPVLTGLRLALSRSWMVLVAAELVAAESGIGQMMEMGRQMMRIDVVMVGVVLTGGIGFVLDRGFKRVEQRLVRWRHR